MRESTNRWAPGDGTVAHEGSCILNSSTNRAVIRDREEEHTAENPRPTRGALVISLDFELRWGVRDRKEPMPDATLAGARVAVPRILDLFEEFEIAATWATVGFLFAANSAELRELSPRVRPGYVDPGLDPYDELLGEEEAQDPFHFGGSLIERVVSTPRQEVGTHTFSHYYCLEEGQDREAFRADLKAATAIAARRGIRLRSIVFPRNQHNPAYDDIVLECGIIAYRGNPTTYAWRFGDALDSRSSRRRALRFLDAYVPVAGSGTTAWCGIVEPNGLANVRASLPLRPYHPRVRALDRVRLERLRKSLRDAARGRRVFHLWWHPHNFGNWTDENLRFLRAFLEEVARLRQDEGLLSLTMAEAADLARQTCGKTRTGGVGAP